MPGNDLILAAVGPLQFEVMQYRLKQEYSAETTLERLPYKMARWATGPQEKLEALSHSTTVRCLQDLKGRLVAVFRDSWSLENAIAKNKELEFKAIAPEN
jgi:peptide chain release factor 3